MQNRTVVVQNALEQLIFLHLLARSFLHGPNSTKLLQRLLSSHKRYEISYCFNLMITEDMEMKAKLSTLTRRLEDLEIRNYHEVRGVTEASMPNHPCFICQSTDHQGEHCPTIPSVRDMMAEHANVVGQYKPPTNAPFGNTYNPNWRNHPNLS